MEEDRYEAFEIIIKARQDGQSWFDVFVDQVTETCEGGLQPDGSEASCTCGMESAGGMTGTLDQCYKWTGIDDDKVTVDKADLLKLLRNPYVIIAAQEPDIAEVADRLMKECTSWDDFLASIEDYEDDEEDDDQ